MLVFQFAGTVSRYVRILGAHLNFRNIQAAVAYDYWSGSGLPPDAERAAYWSKRAAEAGNPEAQHLFALCHLEGYGTERNFLLAFRWYSRAAEQGHAPSEHTLG